MERLEMQFVLKKNPEEPEALNEMLQVLYVVEGNLTVRSHDEIWKLGKEDVMVLSIGSMVSISSSEEVILAKATYTAQMLKTVLREEINVPLHSVKLERQQNMYLHKELKEVFSELIYDEIKRNGQSVCMQMSLLLRLMALLEEDFFPACAVRTVGEVQDVRLQRMLNYVLTNYQENISLSDLADQMYVSVSTLSRLFKKGTGMQFTDYVNQVRMQNAMWDLVRTDKNIVKIAMDSGYSNLSTFNRVFKEINGVSPRNTGSRRSRRPARRSGKRACECSSCAGSWRRRLTSRCPANRYRRTSFLSMRMSIPAVPSGAAGICC